MEQIAEISKEELIPVFEKNLLEYQQKLAANPKSNFYQALVSGTKLYLQELTEQKN